MAPRAEPVTRWPGGLAVALVLTLLLGPVLAVLLRAEGTGALGPGDWAAIRFTLVQAILSAGLSVLLAIPVARALTRRRFPGRALLITLLGAPFILPVIVAILGLLAVFGRSGVLSTVLGWVGLPPVQIYGLHGVVLAHVFFNLPLATRLILQGWQAIPAERLRLAASLGFAPGTTFRVLEWPMLRAVVPGAALVIFVICLSSFAVALTLGGGPRATTVELAIYQAFRFDFDLGKAARLALVQLALAGGAALIALRVAVPAAFGAGLDRRIDRFDPPSRRLWAQDVVSLIAVSLFLLGPLAVIVIEGVGQLPALPDSVWRAAGHSIRVALGSTALCLALAVPLAALGVWGGGVATLSIALSPLVLGTGAFLILQPVANPVALALPVTAVVNALMGLPFAVRALQPELAAVRADYGRLSRALGLQGVAWWRWVGVPRLARPLGFAAGLVAALSMGDLGVIALFADPDRATLPLQMYRLMGSYQQGAAAGAALLLLALSLGLFWIFDQGGRRYAAA